MDHAFVGTLGTSCFSMTNLPQCFKFFIASRRMYASSKRQFIHIQKLSSIGFPSTVSSFSRKWVPNQDTLTLYPQSGSQTTCHSANSIKVPHWILRITFCYIIIVNHLVSLSWQKPKVPAGRLDWQISLPTTPMNLWIIGPSKSRKTSKLSTWKS